MQTLFIRCTMGQHPVFHPGYKASGTSQSERPRNTVCLGSHVRLAETSLGRYLEPTSKRCFPTTYSREFWSDQTCTSAGLENKDIYTLHCIMLPPAHIKGSKGLGCMPDPTEANLPQTRHQKVASPEGM